MNDGLSDIWQEVRNKSWQKQEQFVDFLITEVYEGRSLLLFLADDKYVGNSGFKHVEGTVREKITAHLSDFKTKIDQLKQSFGEDVK